MGQIWGFFRSVSVHFGSASQNVLKLIWKSPRFVKILGNQIKFGTNRTKINTTDLKNSEICPILGPIWPNLVSSPDMAVLTLRWLVCVNIGGVNGRVILEKAQGYKQNHHSFTPIKSHDWPRWCYLRMQENCSFHWLNWKKKLWGFWGYLRICFKNRIISVKVPIKSYVDHNLIVMELILVNLLPLYNFYTEG